MIAYTFFDYEILYFLFFTMIGIVGIFFRTALALLLLDIFWRFPILTKVINVRVCTYIGRLVAKKEYHSYSHLDVDLLILLCVDNLQFLRVGVQIILHKFALVLLTCG